MKNMKLFGAGGMKNIFYILFLLLLTSSLTAVAENSLSDKLESIKWEADLKLPSLSDQENPGVAGPFTGFVGNQLVIAGGANFPDAMPWDGGIKTWWQTAYAINVDSKEANWNVYNDFLPEP